MHTMDFLKRNWSTLVLIGAVAAYMGLSLGTDRCPMCVVSNLVLGTSGESSQPSNTGQVMGEQESPEWSVKTIAGKDLSSESTKGKVSIVVYWAIWCAPCREEIPTLIALRNDYPEHVLEIIGVSLDHASKSIESYVATNKMNYDIARNNESLDQAFGPIRYIPTIVILDQQGRIQQRYTGVVGSNVIRGQVEALLSANS